jgi:hypothetical protein
MKLTLLHKLLIIALVGIVLLWGIPRWLGRADSDTAAIAIGQDLE